MPSTGYFPLRWESTGDQWWFASPIDYAAANGHYDLVRELLRIDPNLLIKLTSLPRIRRLESVWDDEENSTNNIAKCRAHVARKLLRECDASKGHDSLIRAGYGGWLLYTAASAGDVIFVKELLDRDPFLVFGEGEYGVTDIFYAASRSKNCEVFRLLLDCSLSLKDQQNEKCDEVFKSEMMNRAVHASARGGNVEMLRELLGDKCGVLEYRDAQGSSLLHTASGRGKVEVVKYLISSYDIIAASVDNQGNTVLHVAAFRGHLTVLEILLSELSPSSASATNHDGDTFLHMAIAGFHASGFRRIDKQIDLMKRLLSGDLINLEHIVNVKNNDGRTALHMAVIEDVQSDIVELLMSVCYMSLNERDNDGSTPLDLLKRRPRSASSEILIKRLVSLGGVSNHHEETTPSNKVKTRAMECSPGTSFRIPDSEIILCAATDDTCPSSCGDLTVSELGYSGEIEQASPIAESYSSPKLKRFSSVNKATTYLKILLRKQAKKSIDATGDDCSVESYKMRNGSAPIPLRQQFAAVSSFPSNKRILSLQGRCSSPSLSMKKKVTNRRANHPYAMLKSNLGSPSSSAFSESYCSSPVLVDDDDERRMGENLGARDSDVRCSISYHSSPHNEKHDKMKLKQKHASFNMRLMNKYLCFGAQGLAVEDSITSRRHTHIEIDQALVV